MIEFLGRHPGIRICLTQTILGEYLAGIQPDRIESTLTRLNRFELIDTTSAAALCYAEVYRTLRARGGLIGATDMWIAAVALSQGLPVVTKNSREFERVPGLSVITY